MDMGALILSRWQFAITTIYHFLFVPVTLGLSIFVALLETWYINSGSYEERIKLKKLVKFFGTIFLINFAMGVVTGIVQEFHFGMNWSEYARFMGDIFGAPLALEALTAFFIESTFIGIWIFGWDKLSEKCHCLCIWLVAFGSNLSAFWILVANSFMQHPVGYAIEDGHAVMTSLFDLITNCYVFGEYTHSFFAGITTAGFLVIVVSVWKIATDEISREIFLKTLRRAVLFSLLGIFGVMGSGHLHTQYLAEANPMKLASFEALWETENPAPFAIFADVNQEMGRNDSEIAVPYLFTFMLHNSFEGEVKGINDLQKEYQKKYGSGYYIPDVRGMFWSFRAMVGIGGLLLLIVFSIGVIAFFCSDFIKNHACCFKFIPLILPLPFIANSVGWYIAEAGRQPWIVVGLQKTINAVSPNLSSGEVWLTLIGFTAIYLFLAILAVFAAVMFIRRTKISEEV